MAENNTLIRIHEAAREEFMEKGYQGASLRNIVRKAGVTTGAFYGYYVSKEALFSALVRPAYDRILGEFKKAQADFAALPNEEQPKELGRTSNSSMQKILRYAYDHLESCRLLLCRAEGTPYAGMLDEMVQIETEATHRYWDTLRELGNHPQPIDAHLEHMLITGMFNTFLELVRHEMTYEEAENYLRQMRAFYTAGWMALMDKNDPDE